MGWRRQFSSPVRPCAIPHCMTLYMPGLVALRHNPILQVFGERMKTNGLAPKAVVGAAMRKLAHLIYGVVKSGKPFDANFAMNRDFPLAQIPNGSH